MLLIDFSNIKFNTEFHDCNQKNSTLGLCSGFWLLENGHWSKIEAIADPRISEIKSRFQANEIIKIQGNNC